MQGVQERIVVESRLALQGYQTALSQLYAARRSREAAEAVYASEVRQFHAGASTTFLVLQREVELAQARGAELQAQTSLNKAVVELQRVEGTILSANGVQVETWVRKRCPNVAFRRESAVRASVPYGPIGSRTKRLNSRNRARESATNRRAL